MRSPVHIGCGGTGKPHMYRKTRNSTEQLRLPDGLVWECDKCGELFFEGVQVDRQKQAAGEDTL